MPELKKVKHKVESDSLALAKGKNKDINLANDIFATADKFLMELGLVENTYYHRSREKQLNK